MCPGRRTLRPGCSHGHGLQQDPKGSLLVTASDADSSFFSITVSPGITSRTNDSCPNPCPRVCFQGTPNSRVTPRKPAVAWWRAAQEEAWAVGRRHITDRLMSLALILSVFRRAGAGRNVGCSFLKEPIGGYSNNGLAGGEASAGDQSHWLFSFF